MWRMSHTRKCGHNRISRTVCREGPQVARRLLFHKEKQSSAQGGDGLATFHFPAVVRIPTTPSGTKKGRWRRFCISYSPVSSPLAPMSMSLSQSGLIGQPYLHMSPKSGDKLPPEIETLPSAYPGSPKVLSSWYACASTAWPPDRATSFILKEGHIPRVAPDR